MIPKFRVWVDKTGDTRKKIKKWMFYVGYVTLIDPEFHDTACDGTSLVINGEQWTLAVSDSRQFIIDRCPLAGKDGYITSERVGDSVLMQSSGMRDMDQQEIWEGDVLGLFYDNNTKYDLGRVAIENGTFVVYPEDSVTFSCLYNIAPHWCRVIGNVYQNPELIPALP